MIDTGKTKSIFVAPHGYKPNWRGICYLGSNIFLVFFNEREKEMERERGER